MDLITQTITDLFFVVSVQDLSIPVWTLVKGALLGIAATLGAALVPALEATGVPASEALSRSRLETRFRGTMPLASVIGLGVIAVGCGLVVLPVRTLLLPFLGLAALIIGGALLTPAVVILVGRALAPLLGRVFGSLGAMAARGIAASISRTAVAIAALSVAISVTISIDTMVHSFPRCGGTVAGEIAWFGYIHFSRFAALVSDGVRTCAGRPGAYPKCPGGGECQDSAKYTGQLSGR